MLADKRPVRALLGYRHEAPSAGDKLVAEKFVEYLNDGKSFVDAWVNANIDVGLSMGSRTTFFNYAVITKARHKDDHLPGKGYVNKKDDKGNTMYYWYCKYETYPPPYDYKVKSYIRKGPYSFSP
jgi:hypothetical protein